MPPGRFCGLPRSSCAQFADDLPVGGLSLCWRSARELVGPRAATQKRSNVDGHKPPPGGHEPARSADYEEGNRGRAHSREELPRVPHGVRPKKPFLREGRRGADRWTAIRAIFARNDLPYVSPRLRARCQLLPRRRGRAGAVRIVWRRQLDTPPPEARFEENLPGMRPATHLCAHLLRPGWDRAGGGQLKNHPRIRGGRGSKHAGR